MKNIGEVYHFTYSMVFSVDHFSSVTVLSVSHRVMCGPQNTAGLNLEGGGSPGVPPIVQVTF